MALESIADLVRTHRARSAEGAGRDDASPGPCGEHAKRRGIALCRRCGRSICARCIAAAGGEARCSRCTSALSDAAARISLLARSPGGVVLATVVVASAIYALLGGAAFRAFGERARVAAADREAVERRSWLYILKAERAKWYAAELASRGHAQLARERLRMAAGACEEVLRGVEAVAYAEARREPPGRGESDEVSALAPRSREMLAGTLVVLAGFYADLEMTAEAREALERATGLSPGRRTAALARYRLGRVLEEAGDSAGAITAYKAAQARLGADDDFLGPVLDDLARSPRARRLPHRLRKLMGEFDRADAQARVVSCARALGDEGRALAETAILLEEYPFSDAAARVLKSRGGRAPASAAERIRARLGIPPARDAAPDAEREPARAKEAEEGLEIIRLDE